MVPIGVGVHLAPYIAACETVLTEAGLPPGTALMAGPRDKASEVLAFWFAETRPHQWFAKGRAFVDLVRQFWLMPLMHAEELAVQEAALPLFERFSDSRTVAVACRHRAHASEPLGPWVRGKWPVLTQMVQPASLQGRCTLPGGLRSQLPAG